MGNLVGTVAITPKTAQITLKKWQMSSSLVPLWQLVLTTHPDTQSMPETNLQHDIETYTSVVTVHFAGMIHQLLTHAGPAAVTI